MKISVNTIRFLNQRYGCAGDPAQEGVERLVEKIGAQLGAIEEIIDVGSKYAGIYIVKVVECGKLENSDHLNKCLIDDGGKVQDIDRDDNDLVQVITGAPNIHQGMVAVWLPPDATVPSTFGKDPFILEARIMRGAMSHGMLASAKELGIGDAHEGILEIDEEVAPGTPFAEKYNLTDDKVLDIENKMFTHRPDCFGFMGVAREIAGIQQQRFTSPDWYSLESRVTSHESGETLKLEVKNELPDLVPRFTAITMRDVEVKESPVWLQIELAKVGLRPINNIVDLTNYFMLETGQPLHAYDYDKLRGSSFQPNPDPARMNMMAEASLRDNRPASITVRFPKPGEKIKLLNGKEIEPKPEMIMIASDTQLIGVGGVMGGADTEVDENTKNIVLEAANFDMYSIRRTSMALGLFTDAVTRFNKGQSPLQIKAVVAKIVSDIQRLAGGKVAGEFIDLQNDNVKEMLARGYIHEPVSVKPEFINVRLGLKLAAEEIKTLLENVEFEVQQDEAVLKITAPFWRTDIEIPEDIVEEVGRLYGYDKLPLDLPKRDLTPATKDPLLELKVKIRNTLSKAGANEVLTYSFVHGNLLDKVGQDKSQAFQLSNALSPDLQYYRLSLTPSLLEKIHPNIKAGHDEFVLFEIGKAHGKSHVNEDGLPMEFERVALVFTADQKTAKELPGAAYYRARKYLSYLVDGLGIAGKISYEPLSNEDQDQATKYFEPGRSATIKFGDKTLGRIGEFNSLVRQKLKLPEYTAGFELGLAPLQEFSESQSIYSALPRFPKVEQDICLKVDAGLPYAELAHFVSEKVSEAKPENSQSKVGPIDIFQREDDKDHKQITFRLNIASYDRTLTDAEVSKILDEVATEASEKFGAERI